MSIRRMSAFVLLLAVLTVAFPTAGQATMNRDAIGIDSPTLMERISQVLDWAEGVFENIAQQFVPTEGAGITSGG